MTKELLTIELVKNKNNQPTTDSLIVANVFEKRHKDILRCIKLLKCSKEFNARNFAPVNYMDEKGEKRMAYEMTKDGWMFLVMGFTGEKAARFKELFINAFNKMETALSSNQGLVPVNSHVRGKPSGKKEIVLSEKAKSEVGSIVKSCVGEALKAELKGIALTKTFSQDDIHNAMTAEMDRVREIERTKTYRLTELEGSIIDNVRMITGFNYWYASMAFDKMLNGEK